MSTRDARYLAIRWHEAVSTEAKLALLKAHDLQPAKLPSDKPSLLRVNQTDGLSWIEASDRGAIGESVIAELEASPIVQWVSPAFASTTGERSIERLFTVNPKRIYVDRTWIERGGGASALVPEATADIERSERLRGMVALQVTDAQTTSIELGQRLQAEMHGKHAEKPASARPIRYETIPFISPTCEVGGHSHGASPGTAITPDDPMFSTQWGLQRIAAPSAWEMARGSAQITVAVIDEGVQLDHPDLLCSAQSWNASSDLPDGSPTGNHGTACAGIIGARLNNTAGVAGVAGGVRVMAIATATWADIDVAEGLYFAADHGARVVSMSFGVYASWNYWDFDLIRDALQYAHDRGLVLIAASGNENINDARFPGSDARTICVGGSNRSDERKRISDSSSESWWGACYGPTLDVVAPCLEIPTTDRLAGDGYGPSDYYDRFNGTSAATPHVAGLAGLILSLKPSLTNVEVRSIIERTCDKISPALYAYANVIGKPSGTWNEEVGYGRINAERALLAVRALMHDHEHECEGCGGECLVDTPKQCRSPRAVPWLPHDNCQFFYERRFFDLGLLGDRLRLQIRITYQHCLKLLGRQQGPLLYTTTLLPGESVRVHEFDRYRRVRSQSERVSVHTSFRQTLASLSQSRRSSSASTYTDFLNKTRVQADTSISAGGGLAGFFGAPSVEGSTSFDNETTVASGASARTASEQFAQLAVTASQAVDAERSLMVSTFEDQEHRTATVRTLKNNNHCNAITYFVRRVLEVYEASTRIESVEWRIGDNAWRAVRDIDDVRERDALKKLFGQLPREGEVGRDKRRITLPTDGTLYEAELAHCSSCEPVLEAAEKMRLEQLRAATRRANLEVELLALEVERRRALLASESAPSLSISEWPVSNMAALPSHAELTPALTSGSHHELMPAE